MGSHLFFYQLALSARVWLFVLLLYAWPSDRARRPHPAAPIAPPRPRSNDPQPCAGLTQKPYCALCDTVLSVSRTFCSSKRRLPCAPTRCR
jgi:hypothetical protein